MSMMSDLCGYLHRCEGFFTGCQGPDPEEKPWLPGIMTFPENGTCFAFIIQGFGYIS